MLMPQLTPSQLSEPQGSFSEHITITSASKTSVPTVLLTEQALQEVRQGPVRRNLQKTVS